MTRILLTGASGQVGGALLPLLRGNADVLAPSRAQLDLSRPDDLARVLDEIQPELIINPAAYTAVDRAEDEASLAFRVNAHAPGALALWAASRNVPLIHFSTDYVFDGTGTRPWAENSVTAPLSVYGASKLAGEEAIRSAGGPHLIVRTSWVYAAQGTNFLRTMARLASERKELRVVADQIGAPTSARTIANVTLEILLGDTIALTAGGGAVNVACTGEASWHGFASAIIAGLRSRGVKLAVEDILPIETKDYPTKATRPRNSRLDLSALRQRFDIVPSTWQQALDIELDAFVRGVDS